MEEFQLQYSTLTIFDSKRGRKSNWKDLMIGLNSDESSTRLRSLHILIRSAHAIATDLTVARDAYELGKLLCIMAEEDINEHIRVVTILALSKCINLQLLDKYYLEKARTIVFNVFKENFEIMFQNKSYSTFSPIYVEAIGEFLSAGDSSPTFQFEIEQMFLKIVEKKDVSKKHIITHALVLSNIIYITKEI